jgi:uncharacterized protein (DUF433 family)
MPGLLSIRHAANASVHRHLHGNRLGSGYIRSMKRFDWTECELIETVPGKLAGQPVLRGTRVRPRDLLTNREQGIDWLAQNHGIEPEAIRKLFAVYDAHKPASDTAFLARLDEPPRPNERLRRTMQAAPPWE